MKFTSSTVLVTILSLLSSTTSSVEAANRHAGTRRQLDLHDGPSHTVRQVLQKRMPLAQPLPDIQVGPKLRMVRRSSNSISMEKRSPAFGAVPMMNDGTGHMVGLVQKRGAVMAHNGQQGTAAPASSSSSDNTVSNNSTSSATSSSDDGDDDEDCDEEEDDDDDDEDCDDEDDDTADSTSSSATSSTDTSSATSTGSSSNAELNVDVNVNLKNGAGKASSSSSASATSSSASTQSTQASSSASKGIATWFTQNGNAGACGKVHQDSDHVIALYTSVYGSGSNCGRTVTIQNLDDGTSTTAIVADMCPSCGGPQDIDLSVGTFSAIDPNYKNDGVRNIKWWFTS